MFGARVIGDSGTTVINENYKAYSLIGKGSVYAPNDNGSYRSGQLTFSGTRPYLALKPLRDGHFVGLTSTFQSGANTWTSIIYSSSPYLDYYIFDTVKDQATNGLGAKVWDGNGRLTYDSDYRYMSVLDMIVSSPRNVGYQSGTQEAAIFCSPAICQEGGFGYYQVYVDGVQLNGQQLNYGRYYTEYHDTSDYGTNNDLQASYGTPGIVAIVDVQGF